jgi:alpha-L-fucosidase 2
MNPIRTYNLSQKVTWHDPSEGSSGSMPLGNGRLAANVWVDRNGLCNAYLSRGDAWAEYGNLLKLSLIQLRITHNETNPLCNLAYFSQTLDLSTATIEIDAHTQSQTHITLRIWIDPEYDTLRIQGTSSAFVQVELLLQCWRNKKRQLTPPEQHYLHNHAPYPVFMYPDTYAESDKNNIILYHRNESSCWQDNLSHQGLDGFIEKGEDPLLFRTFGTCVSGDHFRRIQADCLRSVGALKQWTLACSTYTAQTEQVDTWLAELDVYHQRAWNISWDAQYKKQCDVWNQFWDQSGIHISGNTWGNRVSQGYALQRFINACAGGGPYPIKFNGSLFTADWEVPGEAFNSDYRRWGGGYWHQNTRLPYWTMLASGDYHHVFPFITMYSEALPLARYRVQTYFNHEGANFPETMYFWGTYLNENYGWDRSGKPIHEIENQYIRYYYAGGIETVFFGLMLYFYTQDVVFLQTHTLPLAYEILTFYDQHYQRDSDGKLYIHPAQVIEQWWEAINPTPEVAGLHAICELLNHLDPLLLNHTLHDLLKRIQPSIPTIPQKVRDGQSVLTPAHMWSGPPHNVENPELYPIFPYRHYGVGKPYLDMAQHTFKTRSETHDLGWAQDGMVAALVGLADDALKSVLKKLATSSVYARFPGFWGPNFDWIPDQDQGCTAMFTLQHMLLQPVGKKIYLFPAWKKNWDVQFKLHAPYQTTVECILEEGKITSCSVQPESRTADLVNCLDDNRSSI